MKYYIEYKDEKEFDTLNKYYKENWCYASPEEFGLKMPPVFIIKNGSLIWKASTEKPPADATKITFKEWEELVKEKKSELKWEKGAYVKYLGTMRKSNSNSDWQEYFNNPGLKAGDVGIIKCYYGYNNIFIKDNIRSNSNGCFYQTDLQLITKEEYEAGLRNKITSPEPYDFNEGDLVVVTMFNGNTVYNNSFFKSGEIIQLGGKHWNVYSRETIDNFKTLPFISKNNSGDCYSSQTNTKFRHCTPEEIAYYNKVGLGANINDMKKEDDLPFKIGDEVTILSRPECWNGRAGGTNGLDHVFYPYTFIVKNIVNYTDSFSRDCVDIFDGIYGWHYYPELFVKGKPVTVKDDSDWKIAVHTDNISHARPHVIDYLLSLHEDATNKDHYIASDSHAYYCLNKDLNIEAHSTVSSDYKIIEEKDLPNYPKKIDNIELKEDSPLELKWAVKHSKEVGKLLSEVIYGDSDATTYVKTSYIYLVYPQYDVSCMFDTIPEGYIEISEQEAIDRLNAVINGTPLILTASPLVINETDVQNEPMLIIPINKKQSITEQLWQVIEKEPSIINDISIFPKKRKSIINKLNF